MSALSLDGCQAATPIRAFPLLGADRYAIDLFVEILRALAYSDLRLNERFASVRLLRPGTGAIL